MKRQKRRSLHLQTTVLRVGSLIPGTMDKFTWSKFNDFLLHCSLALPLHVPRSLQAPVGRVIP